MSVPLKCADHGIVKARLSPVGLPGYGQLGSAYLNADCGCSRMVPSGTDVIAACGDHGPWEIIFRLLCSGCRAHGWVLLACGCQGNILIDGTVSMFTEGKHIT